MKVDKEELLTKDGLECFLTCRARLLAGVPPYLKWMSVIWGIANFRALHLEFETCDSYESSEVGFARLAQKCACSLNIKSWLRSEWRTGEERNYAVHDSIDVKVQMITADCCSQIVGSFSCVWTRRFFHAHKGGVEYATSNFLGTRRAPVAVFFLSGDAAQVCEHNTIVPLLNRLMDEAAHRVDDNRCCAAVDATWEAIG